MQRPSRGGSDTATGPSRQLRTARPARLRAALERAVPNVMATRWALRRSRVISRRRPRQGRHFPDGDHGDHRHRPTGLPVRTAAKTTTVPAGTRCTHRNPRKRGVDGPTARARQQPLPVRTISPCAGRQHPAGSGSRGESRGRPAATMTPFRTSRHRIASAGSGEDPPPVRPPRNTPTGIRGTRRPRSGQPTEHGGHHARSARSAHMQAVRPSAGEATEARTGVNRRRPR